MDQGNVLGSGQHRDPGEVKGHASETRSIFVCFSLMILSYMEANSTCNKIDFTSFGVLPRKCTEIRESQGRGVEKVCKGEVKG